MSKTMKDFDREGMLTLLKNEQEAHRYILAVAIIAFAKLSPEGQRQTLEEMQRIVEGYNNGA